jgi:transcriptional regulator with XRE-family HTH domain
MGRPDKENLAEFVKRVISQKRLKLREVERRSGRKITNSYISGIVNGKITNVTLDKLKALAKGLEVDIYELFVATTDRPRLAAVEADPYERPDAAWLLEMMQEVAASPELLKLLHELVQLPAKDRQIVIKVIDSITRSKRPARSAPRRTAGRKRAL